MAQDLSSPKPPNIYNGKSPFGPHRKFEEIKRKAPDLSMTQPKTRHDFSKKHSHVRDKVKLDLVKQKGLYTLVVAVYSTHKRGLKATNAVNPAKADSKEKLKYLVEVAAGACAEYLAGQYGDILDPDKCAKLAGELFYELFKQLAYSGKETGSVSANY